MEPQYLRRFFSYSTGYVVLGAVAGVAVQQPINIANQYDFECVYLTGSAIQGAGAATVSVFNWPGLVQIQDSTLNQTWFDQVGGVPYTAVVGTGAQPYPIGYPRRCKGNSTLVVTFTQLQALATSVDLVLNGYLLIPQ
jgi:hypothetical protein